MNEKTQNVSRSAFEIVLVAFFIVLASWYWSVDEHVVFIVIFAGSSLLALQSQAALNKSLSSVLSAGLYLTFLLWLGVSTLWSGVFHLSLSYAVIAVLVAVSAVLLAYSMSPKSVLLGVASGVGFILIHATISDGKPLSEIVSGRILGLFTNISSMSFLLGVGLVAILFVPTASFALRLLTIAAGGFFLALVQAQDVLTNIFASIAAIAVSLMVIHVRSSKSNRRNLFGWAYAVLVFLGATLFWFFREPILRPLGEGPDLSGRVILWDWYFEAFLWRPFLGAGWGNTVGWPPLQPDRLAPAKEFYPAHNGFIDLGLVLGGVGALLMISTLAALFFAGVKLATNKKYSTAYIFIPALITYLTLNDLMATSLPRLIGLSLVGLMVGMVLRAPEPSSRTGIGWKNPAFIRGIFESARKS